MILSAKSTHSPFLLFHTLIPSLFVDTIFIAEKHHSIVSLSRHPGV
jgi:hypothetical protein